MTDSGTPTPFTEKNRIHVVWKIGPSCQSRGQFDRYWQCQQYTAKQHVELGNAKQLCC